jgi:glycosyltransferase involved in cell wall biosynthesis
MRFLIKTVRFLIKVIRPKKITHTQRIIDKLVCGFSEQATIDLKGIIRDVKFKPKDKAEAAIALARWQFSYGNFEKAHELLLSAREHCPKTAKNTNYYTLEINCLFELRKYDEARIKIDSLLKKNPKSTGLRIAKSNTFQNSESPEADQLDCINQIYRDHHFATIEKSDSQLPLRMDNLTSSQTDCSIPTDQQPKISILIPAYSAAKTLHIAVNSLLNQTWKNIEIIIVDDCSPDETLTVANKLSEQDPRIQVHQNPSNSGSYTARNLALKHATGEFVTVHDADDWSHPQKLEKQIRHLIDHPEFTANCSHWIRCYCDLKFRYYTHLNWNYSSLMLRKQVLIDLGGWDEVRIGADSEFFRRIRGKFGKASIHYLMENIPLAFALLSDESLTQNPPTHMRTQMHGVRRMYHESSFDYYQYHAQKYNWKVKLPNQERAFPAPKAILPKIEPPANYDILFIMDACLGDQSLTSHLSLTKAAQNPTCRIAIFHWRHYELDPKSELHSDIVKWIHDRVIDRIAPGEEVYAKNVVVTHPKILQYAIDLAPKIHCGDFSIIKQDPWYLLNNSTHITYDAEMISANVRKWFGVEARWIENLDISG